jgi:hypothetical protein
MKNKDRAFLIKKREKEAIKLQKRYNFLLKINRSPDLIPLEKPIRDGWVRYFVLRTDNINPKLKPTLLYLLKILNNNIFCKNKKFMYKDWKTRKLKPILQTLTELDEKTYNALEEKYRKYFFLVWKKQYYFSNRLIKKYVFKYPDYYVFRIKPSYITHTAPVDGMIAAEQNKIENKLWNRDFFAMKYGGYSRGKDWLSEDVRRKRRLASTFEAEQVKEALYEN